MQKKLRFSLQGVNGDRDEVITAFRMQAQHALWSWEEIEEAVAELSKGDYSDMVDALSNYVDESIQSEYGQGEA